MTNYSQLLVRDLRLPEKPMILDIGCGTGISTFTLMKHVQEPGGIIGMDVSQAMIDVATQLAQTSGYTHVTFQKGDAEHLTFPDAAFHLVMSNMTFQFLPNKAQALQEIYRVLVPKGHVALSFPGDLHVRVYYEIYERVRAHYAEYQLPRMPPTPHISLEEAHELFATTGFRDLQIYALHQLAYADLSQFLSAWGHNFWKLDRAPRDIRILTTALTREIAKCTTEKGVKVNSYIIFAHGTK